ncbi:MAG TPA: hypothetical protein DD413_01650 [Ruminococcus sp.]|nr:hypothetical protein [Ruminococcus sp.]
MANKEIIVKDNVDIVIYSAAVQAIANKFFDDENNYTPHFGRANAITAFFNYFVDSVSLNSYFEDIKGDLNVDFLLANEDCLNLYNEALKGDGTFRLDFCNAYADAIDIVNQKKNSIGNIIDRVQNAISMIVDKNSSVFTGENLEKLTNIAKDVSKGNLSAESIVTAYGNSQRIKDIAKKV